MSGTAGGLACRRPLPPLLVTQRRSRPDSTSECSCGCFRMWDRPEEHQSAGRPLTRTTIAAYQQKITFGELRASCVHHVLVCYAIVVHGTCTPVRFGCRYCSGHMPVLGVCCRRSVDRIDASGQSLRRRCADARVGHILRYEKRGRVSVA